jgi:hypothetical protein
MQTISLETLESARPLLAGWGLRDAERGWRNLAGIATALHRLTQERVGRRC